MVDESTQRAQGTLLGLACGDVLGSPVEGWSPFRIRDQFGVLRDVCEPFDVRRFVDDRPFRDGEHARWMVSRWRLPGVYSDDTQQALLLVHSLASCGGLQVDDVRRRFVEASQPCDEQYGLGVLRGYGRGLHASLQRLAAGLPIEQSAAPSAGNGAAIRIAPVGFFFRHQIDDLAEKVIEVSRLTHREVRGLTAACMVGFVVAEMACRTPPVRADALLYDTIDFCRQTEQTIAGRLAGVVVCDDRLVHQFSEAVARLDSLWHVDPIEAVDRIGEHSADKSANRVTRGNSAFSLCSVVTSLFHFLRHIDCYEDAVASAVNGGGDADSIGAMTGAMSGALHGIDGIPQRWIDATREHEYLLQAGAALADPDQGPLHDFYEIERRLTDEDREYRQRALAELDQILGG